MTLEQKIEYSDTERSISFSRSQEQRKRAYLRYGAIYEDLNHKFILCLSEGPAKM